ncbi:MAG: DUF1311 domain-containing protein [Gemmatimonadetes bacterium]|nr:DUF1311 domain-containing protein [Gemmatimonadota bacterium]
MYRIAVVLLAIAALGERPSVAAAQRSGECHRPARGTADIEACAAVQLRAAERQLDSTEAQVRRVLSRATAVRFTASARQWRAYRDAECRVVYESYDGGSGAGAALVNCKVTLTRDRSATLRRIYMPDA